MQYLFKAFFVAAGIFCTAEVHANVPLPTREEMPVVESLHSLLWAPSFRSQDERLVRSIFESGSQFLVFKAIEVTYVHRVLERYLDAVKTRFGAQHDLTKIASILEDGSNERLLGEHFASPVEIKERLDAIREIRAARNDGRALGDRIIGFEGAEVLRRVDGLSPAESIAQLLDDLKRKDLSNQMISSTIAALRTFPGDYELATVGAIEANQFHPTVVQMLLLSLPQQVAGNSDYATRVATLRRKIFP